MSYTLSDTELRLLKPLLGILRGRLSAAGCNDFDEFESCFETDEERDQFIRDYCDYNGDPSDAAWFIESRHLPDFAVLGFLMSRMYPEVPA